MKKWYCSNIIKLLMVILCSVGAMICVDATMQVKGLLESQDNIDDSNFVRDMNYNGYMAFQNFIEYHVEYQSEDYIKSGALIKPESLDEARTRFKERMSNDYYVAKENYLKATAGVADQEIINQFEAQYTQAVQKLDEQVELQVANYCESLIREQLVKWEDIQRNYEQYSKQFDYFIYLSDGKTITNVNVDAKDSVAVINHFTSLPMYDTYNLAYQQPYIFGYGILDMLPNEVSEVFIGINKVYYEENTIKEDTWNVSINEYEIQEKQIVSKFVGGGVLFVVGAFYLMVVAGRSSASEGVELSIVDGLYMDIYTLIELIVTGSIVYLIVFLTAGNFTIAYHAGYIALLAESLAIILLFYLTTLSKRIKTHTLFKHTLIYMICHSIIGYCKEIIHSFTFGEKNMTKQINRILLLVVLIVGGIQLLIDCIFNLTYDALPLFLFQGLGCCAIYLLMRYLVNRYMLDLGQIKAGTKVIREGNLSYKIPTLKNESLNEIADNINGLSEGLRMSVSEAVASEKTKVELVTNVSHDLKTPLTSIINYIDLLSKKDEFDEETNHYIEVLTLKSNQLKKLVEDLFEITKAQNGQIELDISELCIDDLINQILAEYDEEFAKKELEVRITPLENKSIVYADGNKMYRVLGNILGNITKYALDHTRVYIQFEDAVDSLTITFKNVANYEMKFDGSQMGERFMRGDTSRSSDGNGLGLAIAKSFLELQGDTLSIVNDGDLFKVTISLHKKQETAAE